MDRQEFDPVQGDAPEGFYIIAQTTADGRSYLLVSDADPDGEEEGEALILRDDSDPEDEEALYSPVEDEAEFDRVAALFEALLQEEDLSLEVEED